MGIYYCDGCGGSHLADGDECVVIVTPARQFETCLSYEADVVGKALDECPEGQESELYWDGQVVHYPPRATDDAVWRELVEEAIGK